MSRLAPALALAAAAAAGLAACATMTDLSVKTRVEMAWRDPKYAGPPMTRIFVVSLMKVEPGGRDAVEDAIVARLATAGVTAIASHTVMPKGPDATGPSLEEAIRESQSEGVLLVQLRAVGVYEPWTVGRTATSLSPETLGDYSGLRDDYKVQQGDYKIAIVQSELYPATMAKELWIARTQSFDASRLAQDLSDFTLKLVGALARDRMIPGAPKPAS